MRIPKIGFASSVLTMIFGAFGVDFLGQATAFVAVACVIIWVIAIFRGNAKANYLDGGLVFSSALLVGAYGMLLDYHDLQAREAKCNCSSWIIAFMVLAIGVAILGAIMDGRIGASKNAA
jgi:hypothetical protein